MVSATIEKIARHVGETVELKGWLYNMRESGKLLFPQFRDGTGIIQGVVSAKDVSPEVFEIARGLSQESSVIVQGIIREEKRAPGGFEISVSHLESVQTVSPGDPYPIAPKEHGIEFLLDRRHLWLRSQRQHAILKVRHEVIRAVRDYFDSHDFTLIDTPMFTPAACEGTTTLFEVDYFGQKAYLTQSGQLYNEATAAAFGKTYCFGPTFRAEKSKTRRHLTEFWMVEPEMSFARLEEVMNLAEDFICAIVERVIANRRAELKTLERNMAPLERVQKPFPRLHYDDAVKLLKEKGATFEWGGDFGAPDETLISENFDRPVMVHHYPSQVKAFYMEPDPQRPELACCVDVLAPEGYGEIIGGGERISSYEGLVKRIQEHNLPPEAFTWYLDLRKYGSVPHGGFGMGIERCVAWICGIEHLREAIAFPRTITRNYP
ncbi:MAG: asparagine--tRNA ligase [Acidobacteriia bacterium]|nr:asparagine--tRNA ligase [Terriglobia bacterium]